MNEYENNAIEKTEQIANDIKAQNDDRESMLIENEKANADIRANEARKKAISEREKRQIKMQKRAEKQRVRQEKREIKKRQREHNKKGKNLGGYITAIIALSVATLILASVLTITFLMPTTNDNMLESTYSKSFYDTVKQVDNIDVNLSKILASNDKEAVQKYLVNTAINSELAENDIQQLPLKDESKYYTTKLINQIGDYSKYLNNKLIEGQLLNQEEYDNLQKLYKANLTLKNSLEKMVSEMGNDFSFNSLIDAGHGNIVLQGFNDLENLSVDYPELIYDGPFSDGQEGRAIKGLTGEKIDKGMAIEKFRSIFKESSLENVAFVGEVTGDVEAFNIQGEKDGEILFAQISKKGGKLLMFSFGGSCKETNYNQDQAIEKGQEFLSSLGIENMKAVWINLANNVYTINFAGEVDGVVIYPDLIKVRVCAETNMVIGLEAKTYYTNHKDRQIGKATLSKESAKTKLNTDINIESVRLVVVPIGQSSEKLCYEFMGQYNNATYYIYIDAMSGKQIEMFKVVSGTEGELLI